MDWKKLADNFLLGLFGGLGWLVVSNVWAMVAHHN